MIGVLYGGAAYLAFLGVIGYAIGFIAPFMVPKTIDSGAAGDPMVAFAVDALLLFVFAVQHSVMARRSFKRVWTKVVPVSVERSTYVLSASLTLVLLFWQWRALPYVVWSMSGAARVILFGLYALGWLVVVLSTFMLSHFELFGLRQVWIAYRRRSAAASGFKRAWLYRFVRHPLMLGFLIVLWAAPTMTVGHFVLSAGLTLYVLVGTRLEERDSEAALGDPYRTYKREVPMLVPLPRRR